MLESALSPLSHLQTERDLRLPRVYQILSISEKTASVPSLVLRAYNDSLECVLAASAISSVSSGAVSPGDFVSITDFVCSSETVVINAIEKLAEKEAAMNGFAELETATGSESVDITARVVSISELCSFKSNFGPQTYFNLALLDFRGEELLVTFFRDQATKFHKVFTQGNLYCFYRFSVDRKGKKATSRFRFSITATSKSTIQELPNSLLFPLQSFHIISFSQIEHLPANTILDIAGVVTSIDDLKGTEKQYRTVKLVNSGNERAEIKLWGELAMEDYSAYQGEMRILVVKYAQKEKTGKTKVKTIEGLSQILLDIRGLEEVESLFAWRNSRPREPGAYIPIQKAADESEKRFLVPSSLAQRPASLSQLKQDSVLAYSEQKYDTRATVKTVRCETFDDVVYLSCPQLTCKKGVRKGEDGQYYCNKCDKSYGRSISRYRISLTLADDDGEEVSALAFDDAGMELYGISAEEMSRNSEEFATKIREIEGRSFALVLKRCNRDLRSCHTFIIERVKPAQSSESFY